jgi:hypothetical protein
MDGKRADADAVGAHLDAAERFDPGEVDDVGGRGQALLHRR